MRRLAFAPLLLLALAPPTWAAGPARPVYPSPQAAHVAAPAPDPLAVINAGRRAAGVPAFVADARLMKAAQEHADDMANGLEPFGHRDFPARLLAAGIPTTMRIGEGVFGEGSGFDLAYWVKWLNAPKQVRLREPHSVDFRDAGFTSVGVGQATGPAGSFACIDYGSGPAVPIVPTPQPKPPAPSPTPSPVAAASAAYRVNYPRQLLDFAARVDDPKGGVDTLDDVTAGLAAARGKADRPLLEAFGTRWGGRFDARRRLADRADVARSIREAAQGWEGVPGGK